MSQNQLNKQIHRLESSQTSFPFDYMPVILSDSKARFLQNEVNSRTERKIQWWFKSGASANDQLQYLKDNLELKLQIHPKILLYVWLGTCDLTTKNGKFISLKSRDNSNVNQLTQIFKEIHAFISDFPTVKLAFLELPYYSIFHWNAYKNHANPGPFKNDDHLLIEQIDAVNSFIRETNMLLRKYSPKFNCDIQNCRKSSGITPSCSSSIRGNYGGSKGRFFLYSGSINALEEMFSVNTCGVVACGSMCLKHGECLYIQYDKLKPGCTRCYLFKVGTGNAISTNGLFYQLSFFV
ncbi:unnamed protein product [Mytilus edulis]|uniref:Uncharacterized protein n=1 Tax=Mytilus edulis TaxID=6550 RepID=A0A8S3R0E7_MYTED|nr:unnamed protein product [Mytilus edulis]